MLILLRYLAFVLVLLLGGWVCESAAQQQTPLSASGGPLLPEQAAYDVTFYDLDLEVFPDRQAIAGQLEAQMDIVLPTEWIVMDLDTALTVNTVELHSANGWDRAVYERRGGRIWVHLPLTKQPDARARVRIGYEGKPRVAPRPPWKGGFTWAQTPSGAPWVAVSVQSDGADLWWPCKDHPSDEPDSAALSFTVPEPLVAASNGRLRGVEQASNGRNTYHWFVSTPINNYGISLNAAPYETVEETYTSTAGEEVPVTYWVLPERVDKGKQLVGQLLKQLRFFEEYFGPYPFRADKVGVAETPYYGMEHQTIIAYGSNYQNNEFGFDYLLHHEVSHEWWGNLVTAYDWKDFWLHEGFGTYTQALYAEDLEGEEAYHQYMQGMRGHILNRKPVAPRTSRTTEEMYFIPPAYTQSDNDIYYKGAWVLHTLRYLTGDQEFLESLRRMAYPEPAMERLTNGEQCRFATTSDFLTIAEDISGQELNWFFEVYLRQPELPRLVTERSNNTLKLRWEVPDSLTFPMPVPVQIGDKVQRVEMPQGSASISVGTDQTVTVDPKGWILKAQ